jgi:hypothetical protein
VTIFGVRSEDLRLGDLERFLADAGPEPLLWEAKGIEANPGTLRKQVCGFANSHDGGYLIIGASQGDDRSWTLDGVEFPGGEPPTWVANVVGSGGVSPYPDGLDTKSLATPAGRYVAVVRVPASPTPPCNAHGTVYERVSGKTISVREPLRLAALFARGDQARQEARAKANEAARSMLSAANELEGRYGPRQPQFGIGLAASGYLPGLEARVFSRSFEARVFACLDGLDHGPLMPGSGPMRELAVTQDSRRFVSEGNTRPLGRSWVVRANRDGAIGLCWTMMAFDPSGADIVHSVIEEPVRQAWTAADDLLDALKAQGERYLQLAMGDGAVQSNSRDWRSAPQMQSVRSTHLSNGDRWHQVFAGRF